MFDYTIGIHLRTTDGAGGIAGSVRGVLRIKKYKIFRQYIIYVAAACAVVFIALSAGGIDNGWGGLLFGFCAFGKIWWFIRGYLDLGRCLYFRKLVHIPRFFLRFRRCRQTAACNEDDKEKKNGHQDQDGLVRGSCRD